MATIFKSTDSGAPQLSGQAGSLVALLDAVLVDGYGTGVDRRSGAGWTKALSGLNKRAYRNNAVSGTGFYLQVEDPGPSGTGQIAFVRGYSAMTAFDTGLQPTPTATSRENGVLIAKSSELDGDSRRWIAIADSRIIYLFINPWPSANYYHPYFFGDYISYKAGDSNNWCVGNGGLTTFTSSIDYDQHIFTTANTYGSFDVSRPALYLPSTAASSTSAAPGFLVGGYREGSWNAWGGNNRYASPYPDPVGQGLLFNPIQIFESAIQPRGQLPGIIAPLHDRPLPPLVSQAAGQGFGDATTLFAVNFTGEIWRGASERQEGQVIFLEGGDWWQ
ncbi:hypothetical protein FJU31_04020 [Stenotrophomonas cyclobalanopsidis]|uniref:Virion structural protein n=1 Tax=Stenotrophomonas cyclobalanopsidis TaxID=2771362 RepID=A0ABQ6T458_9GAMM|nr:hypothetical protein [Stenotrophomonas cyclobalanopsidis]KAA9003478.1 hypothetical protein FJU31_04020 [Stenotrophomonas cyclobalanopsidis]